MIDLPHLRHRARTILSAVFGHAVEDEAESIDLLAAKIQRGHAESAVEQVASAFKSRMRH